MPRGSLSASCMEPDHYHGMKRWPKKLGPGPFTLQMRTRWSMRLGVFVKPVKICIMRPQAVEITQHARTLWRPGDYVLLVTHIHQALILADTGSAKNCQYHAPWKIAWVQMLAVFMLETHNSTEMNFRKICFCSVLFVGCKCGLKTHHETRRTIGFSTGVFQDELRRRIRQDSVFFSCLFLYYTYLTDALKMFAHVRPWRIIRLTYCSGNTQTSVLISHYVWAMTALKT